MEKAQQKNSGTAERLEQGVKEIFTSERYTEYLNTMSKFHNYSFNKISDHHAETGFLVAGYQEEEIFVSWHPSKD